MMKTWRATEADAAELCRRVPEFIPIVNGTEPPAFERCEDLFLALVQSIVSQQLAVKAADAIFSRLKTLLGALTAENLLAADFAALRACGLSGRKIEYLRGVADAQRSKCVDFAALAQRPDAEVVAELVKLKGVGVWTAEMLLIFALGRPDVLSLRDLGIRKGILMLTGRETLSEEEFQRFRARCSPCGTLASLYLWRVKDGGLAGR